MNQQIVLANPIQTAVNPKPTKREIIEAMVQLKMIQNQEFNEAQMKEKDRIHNLIHKKAQRYVLRNATKCKSRLQIWGRGTCVELEFEIRNIPEELKVLIDQYEAVQNCRSTDEKRIRKEITSSVNGHMMAEDRVQALIESPAAKQALQEMLTEIGQ